MNNVFNEINENFERFFNSHPRILEFKKQAKLIYKDLKSKKITLMQCQEIVAKKHGFNNWHHFITLMKQQYSKDLDENNFITTDNIDNIKNVLLGYDINNKNYIWLDENSMRTHMFIATKDFNREYDMFFANQCIAKNQGLLFLNPTKLDLKTITDLAKKNNREQDLKIINYSDVDVNYKYSHKLELNELECGAMIDLLFNSIDSQYVNENQSIKSRYFAFISSVVMLLHYLKETRTFTISVKTIKEHLSIDLLLDLCGNGRIPAHINKSLLSYFQSIPKFNMDSFNQSDSVMEQHGILQMEIIKVLNNLERLEKNKNKKMLNIIDFINSDSKDIVVVYFEDLLESDKVFYQNLVLLCLKFGIHDILSAKINDKCEALIQKKNQKGIKQIIIRECYLKINISTILAKARACGLSIIFSYNDLLNLDYFKSQEGLDSILANTATKVLCDDSKSIIDLELNIYRDKFKNISKEMVDAVIQNSNIKIFLKEEKNKDYIWLCKRGNIYQIKKDIYTIISV